MKPTPVARIFIADDSRVIRERLSELLAVVPETVVVGAASDVASAEEGLVRTRPDLAILDLQMPGSPVLDLIGRLKRDMPEMRIAIMSTHATDYRERILAAGADFVLHKARDIHQIEEIAQILSNERRVLADVPIGHTSVEGYHGGDVVQTRPSRLVLNVDDYKPGLYARTRILRRAGFEVIEATTGRDTLRLVDEQRPQLVLLDVHLPDMSGLEVCRQIKSRSTLPVAVVHISATYRSEQDRADGLRVSGADAYLTEPVSPDQLVRVLESVLERDLTRAVPHERGSTKE